MASGLFLITEPNLPNPLQTLTDRLLKLYDPATLSRWTLEHRLFRSTPHSTEDKANPRFLHLLTASYITQDQTYIYINSPHKFKAEEKGDGDDNDNGDNDARHLEDQSVIAIPKSQSKSHNHLLETSFGALWMPRLTETVNSGVAFDLGEFVVRLAEVRQADVQQTFRGVVVAIDAVLPSMSVLGNGETDGVAEVEKNEKEGDDVIVPGEAVKEMIRELWKSFGVESAKETWIPFAKDGTTVMGRGARLAQMWCEALQGR